MNKKKRFIRAASCGFEFCGLSFQIKIIVRGFLFVMTPLTKCKFS